MRRVLTAHYSSIWVTYSSRLSPIAIFQKATHSLDSFHCQFVQKGWFPFDILQSFLLWRQALLVTFFFLPIAIFQNTSHPHDSFHCQLVQKCCSPFDILQIFSFETPSNASHFFSFSQVFHFSSIILFSIQLWYLPLRLASKPPLFVCWWPVLYRLWAMTSSGAASTFGLWIQRTFGNGLELPILLQLAK